MLGLFSSLGKSGLFNKSGSSAKKDVANGIDNAKKKTIDAKSFFKKSSGNDEGGGGSSAIVLRPSSILSTKKIKTSSFLGKEATADTKPETEQDQKKDFEDILNEMSLIKGSLVKINESISSNLASRNEQLNSQRVARSKRRSRNKEDELEKKKKKAIPGVPGIAKPGMSLFDTILNYFTNVFLGSLAVFALSKLPQIIAAFNTIGKNLSNTFNQIKASVISLTTNFPKQIKSLAKLFQKIVTSKPAKAIGQLLGKAGKAVANIFGKASKAIFNIIKGPLKNLLGKTVSGALGGAAKGIGSIGKRGLGRAIPRAAAKLGGKNAAAGALKLGLLTDKGAKHFSRIGSIFKRIPFIGALIGIGIDLALGTPPDAAIAGAIGSSLGAAIGGAIGTGILPIPGVGTFLGGFIGAAVGDWAGKEIYNNLKGNVSSILPQQDNAKVQKRAEGGETTRATGVEKRQIRKIVIDKPIRRPGKAQPVSKNTTDNAKKYFFRGDKSLGRFKRISKSYSDMRFVGSILKLGIDMGMGEKPNQNNINVAADSLAYSVAMAIKKEELELPGVNKNTSGTIANSLSGWARREIYREIMSRQGDLAVREDDEDESVSPGGGPGGKAGQYTPEGIQGDIYNYLLSKGLNDNQALGIMANISRESGFRPGSQQSDGPGVGLFQYSSAGRKDAFLKAVPNYANDWKAQVDYALKEDYAPQYLKQSFSSPQEAADVWMREWERPAEYIQNTEGPKIHAKYLASVEKYKTKKGYELPTSADLTMGGKGYGSEGVKIAGDLGKFIQQNLKSPEQFLRVTEHPDFGGISGKHTEPGYKGYHKSGRAIDIGAFAEEQGPILKVIANFNKMRGLKPVQIYHAGNDPTGEHNDHVHVAYALGGRVKKPTQALIGEKGEEFVFDHNTTKGLDSLAPGLLEKLNFAKTKPQLANILQEYSDDESSVIFFPLPQKQSPQVSSGGSGGVKIIPVGSSVNNRNTYDTVFQSALYKNG
jgi:hypothetical protein